MPTAEDYASRGEGEGESMVDADDIRVGSSSPVLRNALDGGLAMRQPGGSVVTCATSVAVKMR